MEETNEHENKVKKRSVSHAIARLIVSLVVVFLAAWFIPYITAGSVDFWRALVVLLMFALVEWYLRGWQTRSQE